MILLLFWVETDEVKQISLYVLIRSTKRLNNTMATPLAEVEFRQNHAVTRETYPNHLWITATNVVALLISSNDVCGDFRIGALFEAS